jgi:phosphate-induced protein 1
MRGTSRSLFTRSLLALFLVLLCASYVSAQIAQHASHMSPTGKGWGEENAATPAEVRVFSVTQGNGISYHGGPVMSGNPVNVYFIWYGNWNGSGSNSQTTVALLSALFGSSGGIGGSGYEGINTTYGDNTSNVSGNVAVVQQIFVGYTNGTRLRDSTVQSIVFNAINNGSLPRDTNGLYFVLTSSDVNETSGFCTKYCGWHTHGTSGGADIKYSFVGNPDRCPSACEIQTTSPNGDSGADGMASIMAHESEEAISDPDLNAWFDSAGAENADKCAWKFGPTTGTIGAGAFNQTFGTHSWLIQMNWENSRGGGCDQTLGGTFYTK